MTNEIDYSTSAKLEADLYGWIQNNNHAQIAKALLSSDIQYVDFEEVVRFSVKHNNMRAFETLIVYAQNTFPKPTYTTILQSAVWDSVVHNIDYIWNKYFDWHPDNISAVQWRERLYIHASKQQQLNLVKRFHEQTDVSSLGWAHALMNSVENGNATIFSYLLQHSVDLSSEKAALDLVQSACYGHNREELFAVIFEHARVEDVLNNASGHKSEEILKYYDIHQIKMAHEQRKTLVNNISPSSSDIKSVDIKRKL